MKKYIITIMILILCGFVYVFRDPLYHLYRTCIVREQDKVALEHQNEYYRNINFNFVKQTDDFTPESRQDILNIYFNNKTKFLDTSWNFETNIKREPKEHGDVSKRAKMLAANPNSINILHYASPVKPWNSRYYPLDDYWWDIAKHVPNYPKIEEIFNEKRKVLEEEHKGFLKLLIKYRLYHFLAILSFGKRKAKYKEMKRACKMRIKALKIISQKYSNI